MQYVCGFVFDSSFSQVLLIRKARGPVQMAGKLNGVGGKIEIGETPLDAMRREFGEEVADFGAPPSWHLYYTLRHAVDTKDGSADNTVFFFAATASRVQLEAARGKEMEAVFAVPVATLLREGMIALRDIGYVRPVYNLNFLLPMAQVYLDYPEYRWISS